MNNKFKVNNYVIYSDDTYWKIYKILGIGEHGYKYMCLGSSYSNTNKNGYFSKDCLVSEKGKLVSKSEVTAFILAKKL